MYRLATPILAQPVNGAEPILLPAGTCVVSDKLRKSTRIIEVIVRGKAKIVVVMGNLITSLQ